MSVSETKLYVGAPTAPSPEKNNVVAVTVVPAEIDVVADEAPVTASPPVLISKTCAPFNAKPTRLAPTRYKPQSVSEIKETAGVPTAPSPTNK